MTKTNAEILEEYTLDCTERTRKTDFETLGKIADVILATKEHGNRIFTAGNGGSAATASRTCR